MLSGGEDAQVYLHDIQTGEVIHHLVAHTQVVECVAYRPDGSMGASGSEDGTIRLWDMQTGACLAILRRPARMKA